MKTTKPANTTTVGQDLDALISNCRERERGAWATVATTEVDKIVERIENLGRGKADSLTELAKNIVGGYLDSLECHLVSLHKQEVYARAVGWLRREGNPISPNDLRIEAMRNALSYAKYNHHSTSPMSNLRAEAEASAWADIAEICGGCK